MRVTTIDLSPQEVFKKIADLQSIYEAMYAIPAGGGEGFVPFLIEHSQREGFQLCAAIDRDSGQMIGFGYGFTGYQGQTWRDSLAEAVGVEMAASWLTGHFEFAEFGVIPTRRRYGIGTQLYKALFSGLPQERAILTVREENEPARRFYDKQRWQVLYEGFFTQTGRGPYIIMGKILKA
jgi:ribosomal protein S18 acetylase RimI-like enzyme